MLKARERKDKIVEIATGKKAEHPDIDWKGMLGGKLPEPAMAIALKKPRGRPAKYSGPDEKLIAEAKRLMEKDKEAGKPIAGRQEFERRHARPYQEICRRGIQDKIWPGKKHMPNKYGSKTTDELVGEAVAKILDGNIRNTREFCNRHRWLYNPLTGREGAVINEKLSKLENKILDYGIRYAKEHWIRDDWEFAADCSAVYNVIYNWKLLPLMKYGTPGAGAGN